MMLRRPSRIALLLLVFAQLFFLNLGFWQLRRAAFKTDLLSAFAAAQTNQFEGLAAAEAELRRRSSDFPSFAKVRLRGEFLPERSILLDSQRLNGQIGVGVYQMLRTDSGNLLVSLGFHAIAPDRSHFPVPKHLKGPAYLQGVLSPPPSTGLRLRKRAQDAQSAARNSDPNSVSNITLLVTEFDFPKLEAYFGAPLSRYILQLDAPQPLIDWPSTRPVPDALNLPRNWRPNPSMPPEKHRGYAATWFGFALTALIIFLVLHRRKADDPRAD